MFSTEIELAAEYTAEDVLVLTDAELEAHWWELVARMSSTTLAHAHASLTPCSKRALLARYFALQSAEHAAGCVVASGRLDGVCPRCTAIFAGVRS